MRKNKTKAESYVKILNIKVAVFTKTEHVHSINTKRRWPEKKDWVGRSQSGLPMSWCDFDASILWGFFGRGAVIGLLIIVWLSHLYIQNEDASVYPLLNEIMKSLYFLHLLHIVAAKVAEQNSAKLASRMLETTVINILERRVWPWSRISLFLLPVSLNFRIMFFFVLSKISAAGFDFICSHKCFVGTIKTWYTFFRRFWYFLHIINVNQLNGELY